MWDRESSFKLSFYTSASYVQYIELIEEFKVTHKESEEMKESGLSVSEMKKVLILITAFTQS